MKISGDGKTAGGKYRLSDHINDKVENYHGEAIRNNPNNLLFTKISSSQDREASKWAKDSAPRTNDANFQVEMTSTTSIRDYFGICSGTKTYL